MGHPLTNPGLLVLDRLADPWIKRSSHLRASASDTECFFQKFRKEQNDEHELLVSTFHVFSFVIGLIPFSGSTIAGLQASFQNIPACSYGT